MSELPPSFPPENRSERPRDTGARHVGRPRRSASDRLNSARGESYRRTSGADSASRYPASNGRNATGGAQRAVSSQQVGGYGRQGAATPPSYQPRGRQGQAAGSSQYYPASSRSTESPISSYSSTERSYRNEQSASYRRGMDRPSRTPKPVHPRRRHHPVRTLGLLLLAILLAILAWGTYLVIYGNQHLTKVDLTATGTETPGTTYLIVGSDQRAAGGLVADPTEGQRADTIMLLHVPTSGHTSLISLPRDSYVSIPGHGYGKLNSSIALGGPQLLVETVEKLSGMGVDHYVQVSMDGVAQLTDAVGGVNLCYDRTVDDADSGMVWEAGCHDVDGAQALAFSRMRKSDPQGDIGRTARQRQVVSKVIAKAATPAVLLHPNRQLDLVKAGTSALTVDSSSSMFTIAREGLALRAALGTNGVTGVPPISSLNYRANGQSNVLLNPDTTPAFFQKVADGSITADDVAANVLGSGQ